MKYVLSLTAAALCAIQASAFEDAKGEKCDNATFAKKAACGNLAEVKMGECAKDRASSAKVKEFAALMVKDHTKAQEELKEACKASKTECPTTMTKEGKEACDKCEKLKAGADFDTAYIAMQIECHQKALTLYEAASKECECDKLKAYAAKSIPTIREHLAMAKAIQKNLTAGSSR
jgi:putative membrane protein